jgi:hypothetical protein
MKLKKKNYRKLGSNKVKKQALEDILHCEICGTSRIGKRFHAHHILSEGAYPQMSNVRENIIAVCCSCHLFGKISFHGSPFEMVEKFNKIFPGRYKKLLKLAQKRQRVNYEEEYGKS